MPTPAELLSIYTGQSEISSFFIDKIGQIWVTAYGAVGDGVTDDTLAVQAAVDAAKVAGVSEVNFTGGKTYKITALTNTDDIVFLGDNVTITGGASITIQNLASHLAENSQDFEDVNAAIALKADADDVNSALGEKVDRVTGKGLSTNDYDNTEKATVAANKSNIETLQSQITGAVSGAPIAASLASQMTDHTKNYVYIGSEGGYTAGHWYYWNGSVWADGGQYQASEISDAGNYYSSNTYEGALQEVGKSIADITFGIKKTGVVYSGTVINGDVLFTSTQVNVGDVINYSLTAQTLKAGYISLLHTNGTEIAYYGKGSSGLSQNDWNGTFTIPANFGKAVAVATPGASVDIHYLVKVVDLYNLSGFNPPVGGYHSLKTAVAEITSVMAYLGMYITFSTDATTTKTYQLVSKTVGTYDTYYHNPDNYVEVLSKNELKFLDLDYRCETKNRLANPLYTSHDKLYGTENAILEETPLNHVNENVNGTYRIPTVAITNAGTILIAAERRDNVDSHDWGVISIDLRRRESGGQWENTINILPYNQATYGRLNDPCFVIDRTGAHGVAGRIYLFAATYLNDANDWNYNTYAESNMIYIYSDDDGETWSNVISVKSAWDPSEITVLPSPCNGIQMSDGTLVIPCYGWDGTKKHTCLFYKKTGGDWTMSSKCYIVPFSTTECTCEECEEGTISIFCNNTTGSPEVAYPYQFNRRGEITFKYNFVTDSFTQEETTFDRNGVCQFAVLKHNNIYLKSSVDINKVERKNITIWASNDCKTWIRCYRVYAPSCNGYSVVTSDGTNIVVVYETAQGHINFQNITTLGSLFSDSVSIYLEPNISVQDRLQMIFNKLNGID